MTTLNQQAYALVAANRDEQLERLGIKCSTGPRGVRIVDFSNGGPQAGVLLARVTTADNMAISVVPGAIGAVGWDFISVQSDHPVRDCMACQYAGMFVTPGGRWFGAGSGPARAAAGTEDLFETQLGDLAEDSPVCALVIETSGTVTDEVVDFVADKTGIAPAKTVLCIAPVNSIAGCVQVAARVLETVLHRWHHEKWDLSEIVAGSGSAPIAPAGGTELLGMTRTNEAIADMGVASISVTGLSDVVLEERVKALVSAAGIPAGSSFRRLFDTAGNFETFCQQFPEAFAPAQVVIHNLKTGKVHCAGRQNPAGIIDAWGFV